MSGEATATAPRSGRRRRPHALTDRGFAAALMVPAAAFLAVFVAWPLIQLVRGSFYNSDPLAGTRSFVGFGNYTSAWHNDQFTGAVVRTVLYTIFVVTLEFVLGLGSALLFNALGQRARVMRTLFLYPLMIAPIVAGLLWRFLLIDNFGIVNHILTGAHLLPDANSVGWLSNTHIVLFSVAIPDIWLTTSFMSLVLFAGLQNIPGEITEAARIDGAGGLQLLVRILVPMLRPVIAVALIVRGIDAARAFDTIVIQTNGGPQSASQTLSLLIYNTMVRYTEPGLASAMSVMYLLVLLIVAVVAMTTIWRPGRER